ncbi:MAG: hypothetical protein RLN85_13740, partial [Pseudomonadales bacterium]
PNLANTIGLAPDHAQQQDWVRKRTDPDRLYGGVNYRYSRWLSDSLTSHMDKITTMTSPNAGIGFIVHRLLFPPSGTVYL